MPFASYNSRSLLPTFGHMMNETALTRVLLQAQTQGFPLLDLQIGPGIPEGQFVDLLIRPTQEISNCFLPPLLNFLNEQVSQDFPGGEKLCFEPVLEDALPLSFQSIKTSHVIRLLAKWDRPPRERPAIKGGPNPLNPASPSPKIGPHLRQPDQEVAKVLERVCQEHHVSFPFHKKISSTRELWPLLAQVTQVQLAIIKRLQLKECDVSLEISTHQKVQKENFARDWKNFWHQQATSLSLPIHASLGPTIEELVVKFRGSVMETTFSIGEIKLQLFNELTDRKTYLVEWILPSMKLLVQQLTKLSPSTWPLWLVPVQVLILPIKGTEEAQWVKDIKQILQVAGIRVEIDQRKKTLTYKTRQIQEAKIPYMLVVGPREVENRTISVRQFGARRVWEVRLEEFLKLLLGAL